MGMQKHFQTLVVEGDRPLSLKENMSGRHNMQEESRIELPCMSWSTSSLLITGVPDVHTICSLLDSLTVVSHSPLLHVSIPLCCSPLHPPFHQMSILLDLQAQKTSSQAYWISEVTRMRRNLYLKLTNNL